MKKLKKKQATKEQFTKCTEMDSFDSFGEFGERCFLLASIKDDATESEERKHLYVCVCV